MQKKYIAMGTGVAVGAAQSFITRQYVDFVIPFISDYLPLNWAKLSSLGNIIIGGVAFSIAQFTNLLKKDDINDFLKLYGITTLAGGVVNGLVPPTMMGASMGVSTLSYGRNGYISHDYYPDVKGTFVKRPATKARGFGSDVTRNPMAAIPTEVRYDKVLF